NSGLVGDANGAMYGSATGGQGDSIFTLSPSGGIGRIATFNDYQDKEGYGPGDLLLADGVLYGTCYGGGADNRSTVFPVPAGGGTPHVLASFDGTNGSEPTGGLFLSNGRLYGTTGHGGANNSGVVFSVPVGGGAITKLADFDDGAAPNGHV